VELEITAIHRFSSSFIFFVAFGSRPTVPLTAHPPKEGCVWPAMVVGFVQ
jgi:hypothetical protein